MDYKKLRNEIINDIRNAHPEMNSEEAEQYYLKNKIQLIESKTNISIRDKRYKKGETK